MKLSLFCIFYKIYESLFSQNIFCCNIWLVKVTSHNLLVILLNYVNYAIKHICVQFFTKTCSLVKPNLSFKKWKFSISFRFYYFCDVYVWFYGPITNSIPKICIQKSLIFKKKRKFNTLKPLIFAPVLFSCKTFSRLLLSCTTKMYKLAHE